MVVKLKFKDLSERERVELVEVKEKTCLLSLLMDRKALIRVIIGHQRTDEYLTEIQDVD
jgi:hypothetical protein